MLLFIFFGCTKKNSENKAVSSQEDSLSTYLSKANDFSSTTKKRQEYIQKAFDIVINQENDSLQRANLFRVANRYYNLNKWQEYRKISLIVLEKSETSKDSVSTSKVYSYLGDYYGSQGVSDSAFLYYYKSEKLYINLNEKYNAARTRLNIALLQYDESDFLGSEISALKALRVLKGEKADITLYELYKVLQ